MSPLPEIMRNLFLHLNGISSIREDGSSVLKNDREACAPRKAGQPGQTVGAGGNIFPKIFIPPRDDETCNAQRLTRLANKSRALFERNGGKGHGKSFSGLETASRQSVMNKRSSQRPPLRPT